MLVETEAIILQSRKYGDTSKIISAFTFEGGRVSLIAKGCRSPKSKFAAMLEPMCRLRINFYKKPNRDLHVLSNSELVNPYRNISTSLDSLTSAYLILETVLRTQHENEKNEELFFLISDSLEEINKCKMDSFSVFVKFMLVLSQMMGFEISIPNDTEYFENHYYYFNFENGTIIDNIKHFNKNIFRFNSDLLNKLKRISVLELNVSGIIAFEATQKAALLSFFSGYFSYHLDKGVSFRTTNLII